MLITITKELATRADPRLTWDNEDGESYGTSIEYIERMRSLKVPVDDAWVESVKKLGIVNTVPLEFTPKTENSFDEFLLDNPVEEWVKFRNNWVSKQVYYLDSLFFAITGNTSTFASIDKGFAGSLSSPVNIWLLRLFGNFKAASNNDSKSYWKVDLNRFNSSGVSSTIASFSTQNQGINNIEYNVNLNLQLDVSALNLANFSFGYSKISGAGALSGQARVAYRKVRLF